MSQFAPLSALSIAREIKAGTLSPEDVFEKQNETIHVTEPNLKVFAERVPHPVVRSGPLQGIAVGIKDIFDTHDLPTRHNSPIYQNHQPTSDAALVSMLKQAGASIAGKTVTTEFAFFHPGETRNPHKANHTPGGSSSGSAAGVAAGFFPAAIGSQTGGSIIRPAAFCGVSGYKPSFRLFPTVGMKCFSWLLDTAGFFAASAADNAFVASACSGRDLRVDETRTDAPRIGIFRQTADKEASAQMKSALDHAVANARKAGAKIIDVTAQDSFETCDKAHATIQNYEAVRALAFERTHHREKLSPLLHAHLESSQAITADDYDNARRTANRARKASNEMFADCDILLTPSAPSSAPHGLESTGNSIFNRPWTLLGMPTVNVAGLKDANGLPLGLQLIAPFGKDKAALQAAHWLERIL